MKYSAWSTSSSESAGFLFRHLNYLLNYDAGFKAFWDGLSDQVKWQYIDTFENIDAKIYDDGEADHKLVAETMKNMFSGIHQIPIDINKFDPTYKSFLRRPSEKYLAMIEINNSLNDFHNSLGGKHFFYWYGQLKPEGSMVRKLTRLRTNSYSSGSERFLLDAVRFRVVTEGLENLLIVCSAFLEHFHPRILGCRNFITAPKYGLIADRYKAIHIIISTLHRRHPVEVQFMTKNREAASLIDHHINFKEMSSPISLGHKDWVSKFITSANSLDVKKLMRMSDEP